MGKEETSESTTQATGATGMVRVHLRIAKRQHDELKHLAELDGRTVTDICRQIISVHLRDVKEGQND
jgi:predicted DNA-binding protein